MSNSFYVRYFCDGEHGKGERTDFDRLWNLLESNTGLVHGQTKDEVLQALDRNGAFVGYHEHGAFCIVDEEAWETISLSLPIHEEKGEAQIAFEALTKEQKHQLLKDINNSYPEGI